MEEFIEKINHLKIDNTIIVTWCNIKYIISLKPLITSLTLCGINNYLIMAMDKETFNLNPEHSYLDKPFIDKKHLWIRRVSLIKLIISCGINCLHIDVDSILNNNPFTYFNILLKQNPEVLLFFGQGSIWPKEIYIKHGFVIRGGFHYTISNEYTKKIWESFEKETHKFRDDQKAFNLVIDSLVEWESKSDSYKLKYKNINYIGYKNPVFGKPKISVDKKRVIVLLPHHLFARYMIPNYKNCIQYHWERK